MLIQKNRLVKAGVTLSAAALFLLANDSEASASQFTSANWEPRTVSEIENEISAQNNEKGVAKYTFQWGDTLWGISQATDISVDKLVQVNDIDNRSLIHVGSTIFLSKDASVISVQNGEEEVVSYDVSTDEVTETETPEEVEESANEEAEVEASQPVEETVVEEEQPAEAASEPVEETQATEATQASESRSGRWMTVEATAYSRNQEVLSNFTFTGIDLRENSRVIAVDPDVIPLGSTVYVPGYGEYVAGDTGGAIIGNRVDLHMESVADAFEFGRRTLDIQIVE